MQNNLESVNEESFHTYQNILAPCFKKGCCTEHNVPLQVNYFAMKWYNITKAGLILFYMSNTAN